MKRMELHELELRQQSLDYAIHELDRRGGHMTPEDRTKAVELKKQRLATKDQIRAMRGG